MKKNIKLFVGIIIGVIISAVVGVSATILYQADEVGFTPDNPNWNVNNLEDALNDLYSNSGNSVSKFCTFQTSEYGDPNNHLSIGSKYSCDPGDGTLRNFYILAINNTNSVDLIMDRNITGDISNMTWNDAMKYIDNNNIRTSWDNTIDVNLPSAQDIANAIDYDLIVTDTYIDTKICVNDHNTGECTQTTTGKNAWLYNYTLNCTNYGCDSTTNISDSSGTTGYWTRDLFYDRKWAYVVNFNGAFYNNNITANFANGVRPVITVLKDNLQG